MGPQHAPYAETDDTRTMRGDCRVTAVRIGLVDPLDRHRAPRWAEPEACTGATSRTDPADAAALADRLGL